MSDVWQISDAVSLAMHSTVFLAQQPEHRSTTARIAETYGFSQHHLAKVRQRLTRAGLLAATRGPGGGVELAMAPDRISLLAIYECIEGPMSCNACVLKTPSCGRENCIFGDLVKNVNVRIRAYFETTTLADLREE